MTRLFFRVLASAAGAFGIAMAVSAQTPPALTGTPTGSETITCIQSYVPKTCTLNQITSAATAAALAATPVKSFNGRTGAIVLGASDVPTLNQNTTGSAATLTTPRTLSTTGDVTTSLSFNGSANVSAAATLATVNATPGTFGSVAAVPVVTVNSKGLVTSASTVSLGSAATYPIGQSGNSVPLLSGTNNWSSTGSNTFNGNVILTSPVQITGNIVPLQFYNPSASIDSKYARIYENGNNLFFDFASDAYSSDTVWLSVARSGSTTPSAITFSGPVSMPSLALSTPLPTSSGGTGDAGTAWSSMTPAVSCGSGSLSGYAAKIRYKTIGKTVFMQGTLSISAIGSCAASIFVATPIPPVNTGNSADAWILSGREDQITGKMILGYIPENQASVQLTYYDNSFPGQTGASIAFSGSYESQ